ncbi:MAG: uroporphyrinogen III decarboxylase [Clostridia bacterium]|nr:uroporphyrinogen III decarboxylase [Clostridia bacterium]
MKPRERVIAAIHHQEVDAIPSGFSYHFPKGCEYGEAGVEAHLKFFRDTQADIYKIMNDSRIPSMSSVKTPDDWKDVRSFKGDEPHIVRQLDMTKAILDRMEPDHFTLGTLHGVVATCRHATSDGYTFEQTREIMCAHYREKKQPVIDAFNRMGDNMCMMAEKFCDLGLDGIMYASLGAEMHYFTDEEYAELVEANDRKIMKVIKDRGVYSFLHMCKENLGMHRYASYIDETDVFNWGVYETNFSLEQGRELFKGKTIWGGLANRSGNTAEGPLEDLRAEVRQIIKDFGRTGFILGADCTLHTSLPHERIFAAVDEAHKC